ANFTDKSGDTFYYINVEETILGGLNFTDKGARHKITEGDPNFDITLEDIGASEIKYDIPVMNGKDEIFIFIDSDYDASTGYMSETIGADKLIQITGQYGIIIESTISNYNGIDNDWNWINKVDTATANDYNEIEVLGTDGNYYIHISSWNKEDDLVEAEILNKITLPDNSTGEDGSRGTPSIPAWNSGNWERLDSASDNNDATTDSADILNDDSGSRYDELMYYYDGSEFMYFQFFLEADPDPNSVTYAILLNDGSSDSNFDYVITSYSDSCARVYTWSGAFGGRWVGDAEKCDSNYFEYTTANGQERVALAISISDSFTPVRADDYFKAVTADDAGDMFDSTDNWKNTRNPSPGASQGDYTTTGRVSVPEFSTIMMPVASVLLIVGNRIRNKKTIQQ
ncbi:hypothetical protein OAO35_03655, partial [Euryarchaeota archaeon]|nr:hypothetical protein [Euryarchaeota archaeon]